MSEPHAALSAWANFYIIMGTAAASLTALMFVAITLVAGRRTTSHAAIATFSSPTIVHFCTVLFTSALMTVPWSSFMHLAIPLVAAGVLGEPGMDD